MAKYFAGTRALLWAPGQGDISWVTSGAGTNYDSTYVGGAVNIVAGTDGGTSFTEIPFGMDATSATTVWFHAEVTIGTGFTGIDVDDSFLMLFGNSTRIIAGVYCAQNSTRNVYFRYWNGASFTQSGATYIPPTNSRIIIDARLVCGVSGTFDMWVNGTNVITVSGLNAAVDVVTRMRIAGITPSANYWSQVAISDFDMRGWRFASDALTSFGTYNEGTGAIGTINDMNLATSYILPVNGNRYTGTSSARTFPSGAAIRSVQVNGGLRVGGGTIANAKAMLRVGSTDYVAATNVVPAPGPYTSQGGFYWDLNPSGSVVWTQTDYNNAQKGHQAVT
jgi:hypothetical protein